MAAPTTFDVERLLRLWSDPLPDGPAAEDAFRTVYTDPVTVNGRVLTAADLVARARAVRGTFEQVRREVVAVVEDGDRVAVAFRMGGRHVGPYESSAGPVPPTGRDLELRVIDVLTLTGGRISEIVMVADELGALSALGLVQLVPATTR
ncbi:ester cyclase [Geodermatophilus telluris]|uniref:ester cyclase n=1 Tax=Geodermatophilus telluris TaxID=1190417 RepID=UPI000B881614|nr:ester cyclase [Geodermatophilus telluris]